MSVMAAYSLTKSPTSGSRAVFVRARGAKNVEGDIPDVNDSGESVSCTGCHKPEGLWEPRTGLAFLAWPVKSLQRWPCCKACTLMRGNSGSHAAI